MKTKLYSVFPGLGKNAYLLLSKKNVIFMEKFLFDKSNFPTNFVNEIELKLQDSNIDEILIPSDKEIRDLLTLREIPYVLVYPDKDSKNEFIKRYDGKGNNEDFINLLNENWETWIDDMNNQTGCDKIIIGVDQNLIDVII